MRSEVSVSLSGGLSPVPTGDLVVRALPSAERLAFSLVVPTFNESHNLVELISLLKPAIESQVGDSYEIIVVDDNSPDGTWQVAANLAAHDRHIVALRRTEERGLATAVVRGWKASRGDLLGVIDADLQHPPEVTAPLIAAMLRGADLAVASRDAEGGGTSDWSVLRLMISRGSVSDPMTGFFIVRRTSIQDVVMAPCGYKILVEVLFRARPKNIAEVGYVFRSRQRDESKASIMVFVEYVQHLLRLRATSRARGAAQEAGRMRTDAG